MAFSGEVWVSRESPLSLIIDLVKRYCVRKGRFKTDCIGLMRSQKGRMRKKKVLMSRASCQKAYFGSTVSRDFDSVS